LKHLWRTLREVCGEDQLIHLMENEIHFLNWIVSIVCWFTAHRWQVLNITPVYVELTKGPLVPDEQLGQLLAWVVCATNVRLSKIIVCLAASVTFFFSFYSSLFLLHVVFRIWSDVKCFTARLANDRSRSCTWRWFNG